MGQLLFILIAVLGAQTVRHYPQVESAYWLLAAIYCGNLARVLWQRTHLATAMAVPGSFAQLALTFALLAALGQGVMAGSPWLLVLLGVPVALMGLYERQAPNHAAAWRRATWKAGLVDILLARHIPPLAADESN